MSRDRRLIIGARGSKLSLAQAHWVMDRLPDCEIELRVITTTGDEQPEVGLSNLAGKGVFVKEIEQALLDGNIDLAVHSLKDLPTELPPGLCIAAVPEREDPRDALISVDGQGLLELTVGLRVATSSLRRRAQLKQVRPDLEYVDVRGNVDTRLRKLQEGQFEALVVAIAGLHRLGLENQVTEIISPDLCLPAPGQGALAIEARIGDQACEVASMLDDPAARAQVTAERSLLAALGGGCQVPIGALATSERQMLRLRAAVADPDGQQVVRGERVGEAEHAEELGCLLATELLDRGACSILQASHVEISP